MRNKKVFLGIERGLVTFRIRCMKKLRKVLKIKIVKKYLKNLEKFEK